MDVLSHTLQSLKVKSMLLSNWQLTEPWGVDNTDFHHAFCLCVMEGYCHFKPKTGETIALKAGDAVLCPKGGECYFNDTTDSPLSSLSDIWQFSEFPGFEYFSPSENISVSWGGGGARTRLIILAFDLHNQQLSPLLNALPEFIYTTGKHTERITALQPLLDFLANDKLNRDIGYFAVASHMAELIYISLLRDYILSHSPHPDGWLRALHEPGILNALSQIHEHPACSWTLAALAKSAGMSRTRFSTCFTQLVGQSPIYYVNFWRIQVATQLLRESNAAIPLIAEKVGFQSDRVFRRAFKRQTGDSPRTYRQKFYYI